MPLPSANEVLETVIKLAVEGNVEAINELEQIMALMLNEMLSRCGNAQEKIDEVQRTMTMMDGLFQDIRKRYVN